MAKFGGKSKFGPQSKFGGGDPAWLKYYRVLKSIALPGFWPQDDDLLINHMLRTDAHGLGHGLAHVDTIFRETFPHETSLYLDDWATFLNVVFPDGATLSEKRDLLLSRWRGAKPATLPNLRELLVDLINPAMARFDDFGSDNIIFRWTEDGNGTTTVSGGTATLAVASTVDGSWAGGQFGAFAQRIYDRLPVISGDDFSYDFSIWSAPTLNLDTMVGGFIMQDDDNATFFGAGDTAGTDQIRVDQIIDGTYTEDIQSAAEATATWPRWFRIRKSGNDLILSKGDSLITLSDFLTITDLGHATRFFGLFAWNNATSKNAVSGAFGDVSLTYDTQVNNVEIIETPLVHAQATDADNIFKFYVKKAAVPAGHSGVPETADPDIKDLRGAQQLLDRVKQAHTLGTVIETEIFKTDDDQSFTDRDVLGS